MIKIYHAGICIGLYPQLTISACSVSPTPGGLSKRRIGLGGAAISAKSLGTLEALLRQFV